MKFTYRIEGLHCQACIDKITVALKGYVELVDIKSNPPRLEIEAAQAPSLDELNTHLAKAGNYQLKAIVDIENDKTDLGLSRYFPIFLIAIYILGVVFLNNFHWDHVDWHNAMNQFMAGFFLVFSAFKLLDIRGFAAGYATYDLLARRWYTYGFIYPFLELSLGVLYLTNALPTITAVLTIVIMGFSSLGVINSLVKKQKIDCACLGTILKVPLSSITLIEDLIMVFLAAILLFIKFGV